VTSRHLPIEACLDELRRHLEESNNVVLEAPPGAGKTTMVPLALLDEPWLAGRKILMLEPRRIAAKSAAYRMAELLGESPGQTVGYRMRLDTKIGRTTRIEVITEGILTRMLQQDPALEDTGLVIFDEFHERSLDSDLALALCLKGRELFSDDSITDNSSLKILVMSATLNGEAVSSLLGNAPIVRSEGRTYPIDIIYGRASQPRERIEERMLSTIQQALQDNPDSNVLAFLPGQGEIRRLDEALADWLLQRKILGVHLYPLYGNLTIAEQQQAIAPLSGKQAGERKIVLATNIAETSLTIEGVDIVVDCGLAREPFFNPSTGMTGLHTVKISKASSEQRAGRAGRLGPGTCYRLWSAEQQKQLNEHGAAEILQADLTPLAIQLLQWGVDDPSQLRWLDPPPNGHWQQALDLLDALGAVETKNGSRVLSRHGQAMSELPVHPRLAHLLICGAELGIATPAALLASLLSDRDPLAQGNPDLADRLDLLSGQTRCPPQHQGWLHRTRQLAHQFEQQLARLQIPRKLAQPPGVDQLIGYLLACAYPDRIARRRHSGGYQLANGRSADLAGQHSLTKHRWLAVAEVSSLRGKSDVIRSVAWLDDGLFGNLLQEQVHNETVVEWDRQSSRFIAEEQQKIGALILSRKALDKVPVEAKREALVQMIRKDGLRLLPWKAEHQQWCARVLMLRSVEGPEQWPDVSEESLLETIDDWLGAYLDPINSLADFKKLDLGSILKALLTWEQQQRLEQLAPTRIRVPSGSNLSIDYRESPPVLAVKLQEMFGCEQTPTIANGKVSLVVHLLSPAGRPLQITQDLAGFWRTSYHDVKKDMKGRYPKHPWPDDPLQALPTAKTSRRK
jgi:ATP-dependent helicase HrpB